MNDITKQIRDTIKVVILASIVVLGMQYAFASPPAGATPPTCPAGQQGCDPPVNVGTTLQEKGGPLGVTDLITRDGVTAGDSSASVFGGTVQVGAFTVSSGNVANLLGGLNTQGGSISAGTGAVTGGQGTFTGGVKVGDDDRNTISYFQLDTYSGTADCSQESHLGRMYFRPNNHTVFVCDRVGEGIEWQGIILEPPPA